MAFAEQKGKQRGIEEALGNTTMNLLKMGMSPDDVSKATGLSVEEIKAL